MTHKGVKFDWNKECEDSFARIKEEITSTKHLKPFDPEKKTKITVDAAMGIGAAATLWQQRNDNQWQPISHHSRSFTKAEKNYGKTEGESLVIYSRIMRNKSYLY